MLEFFPATINLINLPFTILLLLIFLYWLGVILGALDLELFDFDMEADIDADSDVEIQASGSALTALLRFLHIGEVPVMLVISILIFILWALSMLMNHFFNPGYNLIWGAVMLIPNLMVSIFIARLFLKPIRLVFASLETRQELKTALYKVGEVITSKVNEEFGQVEIETKGASIIVNARTKRGVVLNKGDKALVYDQDKEKGIFFVDKFKDDGDVAL